MTHWHVGVGFTGYGPNWADGTDTCLTVAQTCNEICWHLEAEADACSQQAQSYAEQEQWKSAWKTRELGDSFVALSGNLDYERRQDAPLYIDNRPLLDRTMLDVFSKEFPLPLDIDDNRRLYVWDCKETECIEWL